MNNKSIVHRITKTVVDILFYLCIVAVPAVPWWSKFLRDALVYNDIEWYALMATLILTGCCTVYILFVIKGMFKTLIRDNPFVKENVSAFRKIAVCCALIAITYIIKCFFTFSFATVIIVMIFVLGTLFSLTLKDLFKQAVVYKEENDWTV